MVDDVELHNFFQVIAPITTVIVDEVSSLNRIMKNTVLHVQLLILSMHPSKSSSVRRLRSSALLLNRKTHILLCSMTIFILLFCHNVVLNYLGITQNLMLFLN